MTQAAASGVGRRTRTREPIAAPSDPNKLVPFETALSAGLDQPTKVSATSYQRMMARVDVTVKSMDAIEDSKQAIEFGVAQVKELLELNRLSGLALSRMLWEMCERWTARWKELGVKQRFEDFALERLGLSPVTVRRYVRAYAQINSDSMPEALRKQVAGRPMADLVMIGSAAQRLEDKKYTPEQWRQINAAPDTSQLSTVLHEITGTPERNQGMTLWLRKDGQLMVKPGGKKRYLPFGMLNTTAHEQFSTDDIATINAAIQRIVTAAKVVQE